MSEIEDAILDILSDRTERDTRHIAAALIGRGISILDVQQVRKHLYKLRAKAKVERREVWTTGRKWLWRLP